MAQFSQLEQESNTAQSTSQMADQLSRTGALGLIGRTVSYSDADGAKHSGTVTQVDVGTDGKATLTVDGTGGIDAGAVTQVR
jgi:flagellar basal-body rod modification protein FlgD